MFITTVRQRDKVLRQIERLRQKMGDEYYGDQTTPNNRKIITLISAVMDYNFRHTKYYGGHAYGKKKR